ncbi:NAD(P)H-dependent oxidoreductase [Ectobacillus sp. JY-23]|uniref:NAD(P)H-dependent oxidoreductase n=1 Tax=Ectobacillus sp. JY-23 TaxID=2933872 RepID=UPI001FF6D3EE|nr:NAD(P)H-dependent oxidoreductase [Ectobacillus sp. JY-23]UOY91759.1 NAD(P)H-dependent oxidoreductase [Ectobacillus sp. JY-23]
MKNILIINGHEYYEFAPGKLNKTIFDAIVATLKGTYEIQTTVVQNGYDIEEEHKKFTWADVVIYQTPIYWFSVPGLLKTYIDRVYSYGVFFAGSDVYGKGGLMQGKKVMFSTTWNAPEHVFENVNEFMEGKSLEESLLSLHKAHEFVGMESLKTFSCHDVVANPDIDKYMSDLHKHLQDVFGT